MSLALAILTTAFTVGVGIALWCGLMQRLLQAGGILREAADALRSMPSLMLLPPLLMTMLFALFAYWLGISVLLASAGYPSHGHMHYDHRLQARAIPYALTFHILTKPCRRASTCAPPRHRHQYCRRRRTSHAPPTLLLTPLAQWYFLYHTVGLLWTAEVILHLGFCASSAAVTQWYFASVEAPLPPGGGSVVGQATWRALRFAPGSLALGALLVIPGRIFRFFLEHCLHQVRRGHMSHASAPQWCGR